MTHLEVDRSISRQILLMLAGLVLVIAAVDVMWAHQLSGPPETNDDGAFTSRGNAQRRQDILWSSVFIVAGGGAVVFGGIGLVRRRGVLELTDEGIRVRVLATSGYLELPWGEIRAIRSGVDDAGNEIDEPLLVVTVIDPYLYPHNLWGAEWRGHDLRINAGMWGTAVEDVVVHASLLASRRSPKTTVHVAEPEQVEPAQVEPDHVEPVHVEPDHMESDHGESVDVAEEDPA